MACTIYTLRFPLIQALLATGVLAAATAATATPLPATDYAVRPACRPPAPGRASCLALRLEPRTARARAQVQAPAVRGAPQSSLVEASECAAYPSTCLSPQDLRSAYFPGEAPDAPSSAPQTIALVDAYNDLNAEADLNTYDAEGEGFDLPPCTKENGCFKQVGETGSETTLPFPKIKSELSAFAAGSKHQREKAEEAESWALETATDIEVAHAICQNCHILLVEASGPNYPELETAEDTAATLHATEISNSWGGPEEGGDSSAFNHPGIAIVAAAGDDGYLNWDQLNEAGPSYFEGADYPASSPHVISVGGTELNLDAEGAWESESPWNSGEGAGGSGCSDSLEAPTWQRKAADWAQVGCGTHRANADVAADADPATGVNVYDSTPYPQEGEVVVPNWAPIGGTSVAAPMIASMFALAGGAHGVAHPAETLYSHLGSTLLHDVDSGGNGACDDNYSSCSGSLSSPLDCGSGAWICNATVGYDGPTGVGTPNGIDAFLPSGTTTSGGEPQSSPHEETSQSQETGSQGGSGGGEGSRVQPLGGSSPANSGPSGTSGGTPTGSGSLTRPRPRISALALTAYARAALRLGSLRLTRLGFAFRITRTATVRVTLAVKVGAGRHARWRALRDSLGFAAVQGLNRRRLHGAGKLVPGLYRLTFAPAGGTSRSISFRVS